MDHYGGQFEGKAWSSQSASPATPMNPPNMNISDLIRRLEAALTTHGNLPVYVGRQSYPGEVIDFYAPLLWAQPATHRQAYLDGPAAVAMVLSEQARPTSRDEDLW